MIDHFEPASRMSQAVRHGNTIYLAGQVGEPGVDIVAQTQSALASIDRLLTAAGSDRNRLLQATVWLADPEDYDAFNAVWDDWLCEGPGPARATSVVIFPNPAYRVEIFAMAAVAM